VKKGYWMGHVEVHNPEAYRKYIETATPAYKEFGAKFLVRGGAFDPVEAKDLGSRHVVIEFPSYAAARACYQSPTYQAALRHRLAHSTDRIVIVEGQE